MKKSIGHRGDANVRQVTSIRSNESRVATIKNSPIKSPTAYSAYVLSNDQDAYIKLQVLTESTAPPEILQYQDALRSSTSLH